MNSTSFKDLQLIRYGDSEEEVAKINNSATLSLAQGFLNLREDRVRAHNV